ncbi:hypothetical protein L195_g008564 [Trifolium pratense]|uniref:Uncharacterized protein n=1 Tax=Trifolium pratense TaxID=57577 RepID=A0A2K3P9K3_TRIPR|nr:hypothetical protein L195_g008564 [Trifolium pratense]
MKRECRKLKREQQENGDASNIAATIFQGNEVIFVCDDGHVNLTSQDSCWVMDSGASFQGVALMIAVDLTNLAPSAPLNGDVPNRLWDLVEKKIIRSRDVAFFEDQNIEDIQNRVKLVISIEHPINLDPIPLLDHYGGDEVEDIGDAENEPPIDNDATEEVTDGNRSGNGNEDMIEDYENEEEPQLRRSSRIPKPQT